MASGRGVVSVVTAARPTCPPGSTDRVTPPMMHVWFVPIPGGPTAIDAADAQVVRAAEARAARVSMPYLSEVERGRKEASSEILAAICDALGIDLADLLTEVGSDLIGERARRSEVVRLDAVRDRAVPLGGVPHEAGPACAAPPAGAGGRGTVMCLLAA